jgi:hypothetical protein
VCEEKPVLHPHHPYEVNILLILVTKGGHACGSEEGGADWLWGVSTYAPTEAFLCTNKPPSLRQFYMRMDQS